MGIYKDIFLKKLEKIINLYADFLLTNKDSFSEGGKSKAATIESLLYDLKQRVINFDILSNKIGDNPQFEE